MQVAVIVAFMGFKIWMIPVVAVTLWGISELIKLIIAARERQALIARGIDPDSVKKSGPTLR